ncbi:hypothetical protein HYH02_012635 [Chlamydomonas schloesseri]|uniref:Protein-L-isoaspartate O-methyltransferase n=1 Tax=Chlamydomonas schloesseri TaxID=2026947 RepID=A0A835SXY2_9CHLO|nr:hypothetical protein HYH02_012635 [Chlamydomonas schloesseri]|eukprot:KAG2433517.1 hypothetical protein HYH02_012635 [Chlamydomonas schloesseri]
MDLEGFVANRELLERLSREYELLKASGAEVDYAAWVRQRLREAAAQIAASAAGVDEAVAGDAASTGAAGGGASLDKGEGTAPEDSAPAGHPPPPPPQLSFSRFPGAYPPHNSIPRASLEMPAGSVRPETAWFLRGEAQPAASQALTAAIYGRTATASASPRHIAAAGRSASTPAHVGSTTTMIGGSAAQPHAQHTRRQSSPPPVSKLYTAQEPGLFTSRPDAYVHPQARPRRATSPAAKRPDWVNAASLQAALRGASSAVPHLQAAAERERRLALSSALARQSLAAGLSPDDARAAALYGVTPGAAAATAAQYDHVLAVAAQLAAQNEELARAVQENSAALAAQQAVLQTALQPRPGGANFGGGEEAGAGKGGAKGKGTTARATSPGGQLPAGATSKERDRANRKEALKKLLKQVLGGAGLAGGEEGKRRLASGMEEAEKLVLAIQALARVKKGAGAGQGGEDKGVGGAVGSGADSAAEAGAGTAGSAGTRPGSMRSLAEAVAAAAVAGGGAVGAGTEGVGSGGGFGLGTGTLGGAGGGLGTGAGASTGRHPPAPGGIMIESLEDQVADIVQRDAAAYAEAARLNKIDALEQRLNLLVDNVEGRLGRLLGPTGPLAATAQQLAALQLAGGGAGGMLDDWEVVLGPDGQPLLGPDGRPVLRRKGSAGAAGVAAPLSPRSAGLSVLELQKMLIAINRMESKESEIRRKWFVDTQHPRPRPGPGTQPIYARDGWVGTLDPDQPQPGPEALAASTAAAAASAPSSPTARGYTARAYPRAASASPHRLAPGDAARWPGFAAPPTESVMATVDAASSAPGGRSLVHFEHHRHQAGAGGGGAGASSGAAAADGSGESAAAFEDPISDAVLEDVLRGRRRYQRAQQLADGDLVAAADPELNPVQVMEDVTDALLDDLLREHARELLGWCDKVAEHIYDDEFDLDALSGGLEAAAAASGLEGLGKRVAAGLRARPGGAGGVGGENDPARAAALMRLRGKAAAAGGGAGAGGGGGGGSSALGVKRTSSSSSSHQPQPRQQEPATMDPGLSAGTHQRRPHHGSAGGAAAAGEGAGGPAPGHPGPGSAGGGPGGDSGGGGGPGHVAPGMTALLTGLVARGTLCSERVAAAMAAVDRAAFLAPGYGGGWVHAYEDRPLPIGYDQTISAPHMHATALELLLPQLRPGARVLDVGSGSGYLTACLGLLVSPGGRVLGVEAVGPLAERSRAVLARVVPGLVADGTVAVQAGNVLGGVPAPEPGGSGSGGGGGGCWDAIHVGAAAEELPRELVAALAPGGRMVVPVGPHGGYQVLTVVDKEPGGAAAGSGAAAPHGLAPQGPGGGGVEGQVAEAPVPEEPQQYMTRARKTAEGAAGAEDWMRGVRVTQVMGVGYVPLVRPGEARGRTSGAVRRSSRVVPGGELQDCCVVASSPVSPTTVSGGQAPPSARRLPSRASTFIGLLPTQRTNSPSLSFPAASAAAALASSSRPFSSRPDTAANTVALAAQAQWGGASLSSSPAAGAAPPTVVLAAASRQAWMPLPPGAADSRRGGSSITPGAGGGYLPAVPQSVGFRRAAAAAAADEMRQLSLPAMDLKRNGSSRAASSGALSTGGGGDGGASLFRRLQQQHVPLTSDCGDEGSKLSYSGGGGVSAAVSATGAGAATAPCALLPELQIPGSPVTASGRSTLRGSGGVSAAGVFDNPQQCALSLQQQPPSAFRRRSATALDAAGLLLLATTGFTSTAGPLMQPQQAQSQPQLLLPTASATDDGSGAKAVASPVPADWYSPSARRASTLLVHHKPPSPLRSQSSQHFASSSRAAAHSGGVESVDSPASSMAAAASASCISGACASSIRINAHADLALADDDGGDGHGDDLEGTLAGGFGGVLDSMPQVVARRAPSSSLKALGPAASTMAGPLLRRGDGGHGVIGAVVAAAFGGGSGSLPPRAPAGCSNALMPTPPPAGPLVPQPPPPASAGALLGAAGQHHRKPHRAASITWVLDGSSPSLQGLTGGGEIFGN